MSRISTLQPEHNGNLPIKVLGQTLIHHFQTLYPGFLEEIKHEVLYNGLKKGILYDDRKQAIEDPAYLDEDGTIYINEPYLAFLWALCYAVLTLYRERKSDQFVKNPKVNDAISLFNYGLSLNNEWSEWALTRPNPQEFEEEDERHIGEVNGLFLYAGSYVLCHEFSHKQLGHSFDLTPDDEDLSKQDELDADKNAYETLERAKEGRTSDEVESIKLGTLIGVGSLMFPDRYWSGGNTHPDIDERIINAIELLEPDINSDLWVFGTAIFIIWGVTHNQNFVQPTGQGSAKANYIVFVKNLKDQQ